MTNGRKIDLALEAKEFAEGSAEKTSRLSGVKAEEDTVFGLPLTRVKILDQEGEAALGKPKGTYLTLDLEELPRDREEILRETAARLRDRLYRDGTWYSDYVRIRCKAVKDGPV